VRPSNREAFSLYRHLGFEESGVRKQYYDDDGEDAVIMWKK
jgi:ribosomal-protein-alanine N-acetyltransferase